MPEKTEKPKPIAKTTIAVTVDVAKALNNLKHGRDDYDDVIRRLLDEQGEVLVEFQMIDNELPQLHTCVFQLGPDKANLVYYDGSEFKYITLEEANALLKQPNLTMTITRIEADNLNRIKISPADAFICLSCWESLHERIKKFLEASRETTSQ